jgi:hypothetical protein
VSDPGTSGHAKGLDKESFLAGSWFYCLLAALEINKPTNSGRLEVKLLYCLNLPRLHLAVF